MSEIDCFDYEIPEKIKKILTKDFLSTFKKNVIKKFEENDFKQKNTTSKYELMSYLDWWCYIHNTVSFYEAFQKTCKEENLQNVLDYYEELNEYNGDIFDNKLCLLMVEKNVIGYGNEGLDKQALRKVKEKYKNIPNINTVEVEEVTYSTLNKLLKVCNSTKHMEEMIELYDNEEDFTKCSWIDIEGEGYGWLWLKEEDNEDKWHELLKNSMLRFIKNKKIKILKNKEMVIIAKTDTKTIFHFIERETEMRDTIYTFSNEEIVY